MYMAKHLNHSILISSRYYNNGISRVIRWPLVEQLVPVSFSIDIDGWCVYKHFNEFLYTAKQS